MTDALLSAGKSAIVFDGVLNPAIKSRVLRDPAFKNFIIGGAFALHLISGLIAPLQSLPFSALRRKQL